jgi:hypothetical protein
LNINPTAILCSQKERAAEAARVSTAEEIYIRHAMKGRIAPLFWAARNV